MTTWVIIYQGADRIERRAITCAEDKPSEQAAAMVVSNLLQQERAGSPESQDSMTQLTEHYNFVIVDIHPA